MNPEAIEELVCEHGPCDGEKASLNSLEWNVDRHRLEYHAANSDGTLARVYVLGSDGRLRFDGWTNGPLAGGAA